MVVIMCALCSKTEVDKVSKIRKEAGPAVADSIAYLLTEMAAVELIGCGAKQKYRASFRSRHIWKYATSLQAAVYNMSKVAVKNAHYIRRLINIRFRGPLYVISREGAEGTDFIPYSSNIAKEAIKSFSDLDEDSINCILKWLGSASDNCYKNYK